MPTTIDWPTGHHKAFKMATSFAYARKCHAQDISADDFRGHLGHADCNDT